MDRGAAEATKLAAATARMREPLKVAELRVDRLRRTRQPLASLLDIAAGAIEMVTLPKPVASAISIIDRSVSSREGEDRAPPSLSTPCYLICPIRIWLPDGSRKPASMP
jgi:hypothetical protein